LRLDYFHRPRLKGRKRKESAKEGEGCRSPASKGPFRLFFPTLGGEKERRRENWSGKGEKRKDKERPSSRLVPEERWSVAGRVREGKFGGEKKPPLMSFRPPFLQIRGRRKEGGERRKRGKERGRPSPFLHCIAKKKEMGKSYARKRGENDVQKRVCTALMSPPPFKSVESTENEAGERRKKKRGRGGTRRSVRLKAVRR